MNYKKNFFLTLLLFSVLISMVFSFSPVFASEKTSHDKGVEILDHVIGLDLKEYSTNTKQLSTGLYMDFLPQERIHLNLEGNQSKIEMLQTFVNGKLQTIQVLETQGSSFMDKAIGNNLEMAKNFLTNYRTKTENSLYAELESSLIAADGNKNNTSILLFPDFMAAKFDEVSGIEGIFGSCLITPLGHA